MELHKDNQDDNPYKEKRDSKPCSFNRNLVCAMYSCLCEFLLEWQFLSARASVYTMRRLMFWDRELWLYVSVDGRWHVGHCRFLQPRPSD
eukprot:2234483-Amphidinium_carterae.1